MLKPLKIPRGVANVFILGEAQVDYFWERTQFRPDFLLDDAGRYGIKDELTSNYISNLSPITAVKGRAEIIPNELFKSYFGVL
jgi:hypothetical protein